MGQTIDIAVVGAGICGLAVAIALARGGHRVVVYERFETPRALGSGLLLQPPGLAALERLGLRGKIEALGARIDRLHGITDRGRIVFDLGYGDLDPSLYAVGVHRGALHGVLTQAFLGCRAALETGRTIISVEPRSGARLSLVDRAGTDSARYDLVIDASGAQSRLRTRVNPRRPTFTRGEPARGSVGWMGA